METYLVYDQEWEDKKIIYCGTDENIAEECLNEGNQNRYLEKWVDGKYRYKTQGRYIRR